MADKKSFLLRLNPEVWKEIERWAADDFRSVNGQIEFILHEAVRQRRKKIRPGPNPSAAEVPPKEEP
jgi:hypothetical protein